MSQKKATDSITVPEYASSLAFIDTALVKKISAEEVGKFDDSDNSDKEEKAKEVSKKVEVKEDKKVEADVPVLNHEQKRINVPVEKKKGLTKIQLKYYKVLTDSIKDSQVDDKRNGIDSFLTYKKDKA